VAPQLHVTVHFWYVVRPVTQSLHAESVHVLMLTESAEHDASEYTPAASPVPAVHPNVMLDTSVPLPAPAVVHASSV